MECHVEGCARKGVAKQCCGPHYYRLMTYGEATAGGDIRPKGAKRAPGVACKVWGCSRPIQSDPYCKDHAQRFRRTGYAGEAFPARASWAGREVCRVDDCEKKSYVMREQLCAAHYTRLHKYGDVNAFHGKRQVEACAVEGCEASPAGTGGSLDMCGTHYRRWRGNDEQALRSRRSALRKFGLTLEDWEDLLRRQGHRCAICGSDNPGKTLAGKLAGTWCIDHDHKTGKVRGALCHPCNRGIGQLQDSPEIVRSALRYLEGDNGLVETDMRLTGREQAVLDAQQALEALQASLGIIGVRSGRR